LVRRESKSPARRSRVNRMPGACGLGRGRFHGFADTAMGLWTKIHIRIAAGTCESKCFFIGPKGIEEPGPAQPGKPHAGGMRFRAGEIQGKCRP